MSTSRDQVICVLCGRIGTRSFVILSGNGDGTRDSWRCATSKACDWRAAHLAQEVTG